MKDIDLRRPPDNAINVLVTQHEEVEVLFAHIDRTSGPPSHPTFDAKLTVLREEISHHVAEEEQELFPNVARLFDDEMLDALGREMLALASALAQQSVRALASQTSEAAHLGL